jgi:WD40 repeat protein
LMRASDGRVWRTIIHPGGASPLALSPDGSMLVSGGYDRTARIWRVADQRPVRVLEGHGGTVWTLAWSPDGNSIATAGEDRLIRIWRVADGALLATLTGGSEHVYAVAFSPDGRWLASGGRARSAVGTFWHQITGLGGKGDAVRLWRASDGRLEQRLQHFDDVMALAFSPDSGTLATASSDGSNSLWDLRYRSLSCGRL